MAQRDLSVGTLKVGTYVTLKSMKYSSYMSAEGILDETVYVSGNLSNFAENLFQVCIQLQYSASKELEDFISNYGGNISNIEDTATRKYFDALAKGKSNEIKMNETFMKLKMSNLVLFGDIVQLRHVKSGKFLTMNPGVLARDERENVQVSLNKDGSSLSWFTLMPRYKVDHVGDKINSNTELVLVAAERPTESLRCSDKAPPATKYREVNSSTESSTPWKMVIFQNSTDAVEQRLMLGQLVFIKDPETQCLLTPFVKVDKSKDHVDKDKDDESDTENSGSGSDKDDDDISITSHEEYIHDHGGLTLKHAESDFPDTNSVWILESQSIVKGGPIHWRSEHIHLRHFNSGLYLAARSDEITSSDKSVFCFVDSPHDKRALFQVNELHSSSDFLTNNKPIQVRHGHTFLERGEYHDRHKVYSVNGVRGKGKACNFIVTAFSEVEDEGAEKSLFEDMPSDLVVGKAFATHFKRYVDVTEVPAPDNTRTNSIWTSVDPKGVAFFDEIMFTITKFLGGYPILFKVENASALQIKKSTIYRRQKMFREQGTLSLLIQLLKLLVPISQRRASLDAAPVQLEPGGLVEVGSGIISKCLILLKNIMHNHPFNQMFIADNLLVVLAHVGSDDAAGEIAQEFFSTNRELQETKIGIREVKIFVGRMRESEMNATFLNLLRACCSCNGVGLFKNQTLVKSLLFEDNSDLLIKFTEETDNKLVKGDLPPVTFDWSAVSAFSLYLPDVVDRTTVLASGLLRYMPYVFTTWSTKMRETSPVLIYGKQVVNIENILPQAKKEDDSIANVIIQGLSKRVLTQDIRYNEEKARILDFFVAQLYLAAEICLDRNYDAISLLEKNHPVESLIAILTFNVPDTLKAAVCRLLTTLYVDRDLQLAVDLPRYTRTLMDLAKPEYQIVGVEQSRVNRFSLVQALVSDYVKKLKGRAFNEFSLNMLLLLHKLFVFHFYSSKDKIVDIIRPLVDCLQRQKAPYEDATPVRKKAEKVLLSSKLTRARSRRMSKGSFSLSSGDDNSIRGEAVAKNEDLSVNSDEQLSKSTVEALFEYLQSLRHLKVMLFFVLLSLAITIYDLLVDGYMLAWVVYVDYAVVAAFFLEVWLKAVAYVLISKGLRVFILDAFNATDVGILYVDIAVLVLAGILPGNAIAVDVKFIRFLRLARFGRLLASILHIGKIVTQAVASSRWKEPLRYKKTSHVGLSTMLTITNVLSDVQRTVEDRNLSLLLHAVMELRDGGYAAADVSRIFNDAVEAGKELCVSSSEHDDIFIDLLMYAHPPVVQKTLEILMDHHSSRATLIDNIKKIQLISNGAKQQQFELIKGYMLDIKRHIDQYSIWGKLQNEEHNKINKTVFKSLGTLTEFCRQKRKTLKFDESYEADRGSQDVMRDMGLMRVGIQFLEFLYNMDPNEVNSKVGKNLMKLLLASNTLLYWFIVDNPQNQSAAFAHITLFVKSIDSKINSHKIIQAIFSNNEFLIRSLPKLFILDTVDMICNSGKFPQYLALLSPLVAAGQKNIIENQYKVINQFSSPGTIKKIVMFFQGPSHPEYLKKIKLMGPYLNKKDIGADDLPSDLTYHLDLMDVLSRCTIGTANMTTIEAKVQSMFYFADVINSMLDPQCLLLAKIRLGLFLYNAVIDVEMRVSALKDADIMWKLIVSTIDVLAFAKDEIRLAEKEGLHSLASHRQALEYVVVCAMIVGGFFEFYHEGSTFSSDMSQVMSHAGVDRVVLKEKEGNEIIRTLFNNIRSIYDLQSPIFDNQHHDVFYRALGALNKASSAPIVSFIEKLHGAVTDRGAELKARSSTGSVKFDKFLEMLLADKDVQESAETQVQDFIAKLDAIPLEDDAVDSDVRFEPLVTRLLSHIRQSIRVVVYGDETTKQMDEKSAKTSLWVLKILRTMIENRWGMTIDERDDDGGEEQDVAAGAIMSTLNKCGATEVCLDLLARGIEIPLQAEAIKMLVALLFREGGALEVQMSINRHLSKPGSELFFLHIRSLIQNLISWHRWHGVIELGEDEEPDLPEEIILIRLLQLMCEGHYMPNQDIMREQKNNYVNVNLLDDFVAYMQALDTIQCRTSTTAAKAVLATILEVIQGPCEGNQTYFATETELIELLNKKLRQRVVADMDEDEEVELKKTAVDIFQGMLEGQGSKISIYERMLSVIHLDVLQVLSAEGAESGEAMELRTECLVLMQMFFDFKPSIVEEFGIANDAAKMREMGIACVEVIWNGELQRRFFHVPEICGNLAKSTKDAFIDNCNRDSPENKLFDLMEAAKNIHFEILHQQRLKEMNIAFLFSQTNQDRVSWINFNLIIIINLLFIVFYSSYDISCSVDGTISATAVTNGTDGDGFVRCSDYFLTTESSTAIDAISIVIMVLSAMVLLIFITVRAPINYLKNVERGYTPLQCVLYTAADPMTVYNFVVFIFAVLGYEYHFLLTLLLLDYMTKSSVLMVTLAAVFVPWRQICITIALTWIVTWVYAMFYFMEYNDAKIVLDPANSVTAVSTLKWFIRYGSETGSLNTYGDIGTTITTPRFVLEFTFFIIMVTMWNIIKGITIDSFLSLREKSLIKANDTNTVCFMCSIDKLTFTRAIGGDAFNEHTKVEQNLWNYIYFIIFIQEQDKDDDDGLEYYVRHMLLANDLNWFPMNRAMKMVAYQQRNQGNEIAGKFSATLVALESDVQQNIAEFKEHFARNISKIEAVMKSHGPAPLKSSHSRRNVSSMLVAKSEDISPESEIRLTILRVEGVHAFAGHILKIIVQTSESSEKTYSTNNSHEEGPFNFAFAHEPFIVHRGNLNVTSNAMLSVKVFWKSSYLSDESNVSELIHYCNITLSSLLSHIAEVDAAPPEASAQREVSFTLQSFLSEHCPLLVCTASCSQAYIEKLRNSIE